MNNLSTIRQFAASCAAQGFTEQETVERVQMALSISVLTAQRARRAFRDQQAKG